MSCPSQLSPNTATKRLTWLLLWDAWISAFHRASGADAVWSAGVMLYVMLFGRFPFDSEEGDREPHYFQRVLERIQRVGSAFRGAACSGRPRRCFNVCWLRSSLRARQEHGICKTALPG